MTTIAAIFTALAEGAKLTWTIFTARNSPAMQANAKAKTIQRIRDSVDEHIAAGDIEQVRKDGSP